MLMAVSSDSRNQCIDVNFAQGADALCAPSHTGVTFQYPGGGGGGGEGWNIYRGQIIYFNPAQWRAENFKF